MIARTSVRQAVRATRQYLSHAPAKETEINLPKVFGIAAVMGGLVYLYKNTNGDSPAIKTTHFKDFEARRQNNREVIRLDIDEKANAQTSMFTPGWQRSEAKDFRPNRNYNLIPRHSPWESQAGLGIKTDKLAARKERPVMFAPVQEN